MSGIQSELQGMQRRRKIQLINEEMNQSIQSDPELVQMLNLVGKDTKSCYNCVPYLQKVNRDMQV